MKIEIKDASVVVDSLSYTLSKLEIRFPERIARFALPHSEADRLTLAGGRYSGRDSSAAFKGKLNGEPVTICIMSRRLSSVKHGPRGINYEAELEYMDIYWGQDEEGGKRQGDDAEILGTGNELDVSPAAAEPDATGDAP